MTTGAARTTRRTDALSKERILDAAIAILDDGEGDGLTLRAVMGRLSTGAGAVYHHVATMDELRAAAADAVLGRRLSAVPEDDDPTGALRAIAVAIFDSIADHRWLGAQLARSPFQPAVLLVWTTIGRQLHRLGLRGAVLTDAGSTLASYILGATNQNGASHRSATEAERAAFLSTLAEAWQAIDPDPVVDEIAVQLRTHDDRRQFIAGVDIVLAGIAVRSP